jgi:SAM-dependent methyltransferase
MLSDREITITTETYPTNINRDPLTDKEATEGDFDPEFYREYYNDLQNLSSEEAYQHWLQFGKAEGRYCCKADFYQRLGVRESDVPVDFDYQDYLYLNPDVLEVYGENKYKAIQHFLCYGSQGEREYQLVSPMAHYQLGKILCKRERWDEAIIAYRLAISLKIDKAAAYLRLGNLLRQRGDYREAVSVYKALQEESLKLSESEAEELETNLKIILGDRTQLNAAEQQTEWQFDWKFYLEYHEDLQYLDTPEKAYEHWLHHGRQENRCGSELDFYKELQCRKSDLPEDFNDRDYLDLNPDLKRCFGGNKYKAIAHFLKHGSKEGRIYNRNSLKENTVAAGNHHNALSPQLYWIFSKIAENFSHELSHVNQNPIPSIDLIVSSGSSNIAHYLENMSFYTQDVIRQCMLKRNSRVLDLGCGAARIGRGLLHYLNREGSYLGIDTNQNAIDWCARNISTRNANFQFKTIDATNNYYYFDDNQQENNYDFSFLGKAKFDCIIAACFFNHLKINDTRQYLQEISKRLVKDGIAYLTFFTIDEEFFEFRDRTGLHVDLNRDRDGVWYGYQHKDFFAGYETSTLETLFTEARLAIIQSSNGSWSEKSNARIYQDWYLVTGR